MDVLDLFVTAPRGTQSLVADELRALGLAGVREVSGGAHARAELPLAYRACLWCRAGSRVLAVLGELDAREADVLYRDARELAWEQHLRPRGSLLIDTSAAPGVSIAHTGYAALRTKDAVVDRLRGPGGERPSVDRHRPDLRLNLHLRGDRAVLSLDLGGPLHRRGYRRLAGTAPLRENTAAAVLLRARWPELAAAGHALADPMCGAGTLLVEGAWIAGDVAPGLLRAERGSPGWLGHRDDAWEAELSQARDRRERGLARLPPIAGSDADPRAVAAARDNVARAGLAGRVEIEVKALAECRPPAERGLVVTNPPWGLRIGKRDELVDLYRGLGALLRGAFRAWRAATLLGDPGLGVHLGLRASRRHTFHDGAVECRLLRFDPTGRPATARAPRPASPESSAFADRLRKNKKRLSAWVAREGIEAYRLYDADIPEYAVAVDVYGEHAVVAEYAPPASVDPEKARVRRRDAVLRTMEVLGLPRERVHVRTRTRRRGGEATRAASGRGRSEVELVVREGDARFRVELSGHLDTGLFLDHRKTRALLAAKARGCRFLNLFCYTATASVAAARAGAARSTSVDLSATHLAWARKNFELNKIDERRHELVRADCRVFVERERPGRWDLVFLDPPTFSCSRAMRGTFDVQRDHAGLVRRAVSLLAPGGELWFSCNRARFRLDPALLAELDVEDLTARTIPPDFARTPTVHRCFRIRSRARARGVETSPPN